MPTWGDHPASGRRKSPRKGSAGRRKTDRARRRAAHRRSGCRGIMLALVAGCVLWAVLLVPLILWGPL